QSAAHLAHMDGVMLGRAAYHNAGSLAGVDERFFGKPHREMDWTALRDVMMVYADGGVASSGRLNHVTRHMVGLFQGFAGARRYRQILSTESTKPGAGADVIEAAFAAVDIAAGPKLHVEAQRRAV